MIYVCTFHSVCILKKNAGKTEKKECESERDCFASGTTVREGEFLQFVSRNALATGGMSQMPMVVRLCVNDPTFGLRARICPLRPRVGGRTKRRGQRDPIFLAGRFVHVDKSVTE